MHNKKGFGLVGLLITLAIILALAGGAMYYYFNRSLDVITNPGGGDKTPIEKAKDIKDVLEERDRTLLDEY